MEYRNQLKLALIKEDNLENLTPSSSDYESSDEDSIDEESHEFTSDSDDSSSEKSIKIK